MTISNTQNVIRYNGDGTNASLPTTFPFVASSELVVTSRVIATGVESLLVLGTHYTVTGGGGGVGTVEVVNGAADFLSTVQWTIQRVTPATQETDLVDASPLSEQALEAALDKLTRRAQEALTALTRALRAPGTDVEPISELPSSIVRADKFLFFDSAGNPTVLADASLDPTLVAVSVFGESVVAAASAAALRTLLQITYGTLAARPAAPTAGAGSVYFATDAQLWSYSDGAIWIPHQPLFVAADALLTPGAAGFDWLEVEKQPGFYKAFSVDSGGATEIRSLPPGAQYGQELTWNSTSSLTLSAGQVRDFADAHDIRLASAMQKNLNATGEWSAGAAGNAIPDVVVLTDDTIYSVFSIAKSDGTTDWGIDSSATAANLRAAAAAVAGGTWPHYRRRGYIVTENVGAGDLAYRFVQLGDRFDWGIPKLSVNQSGKDYRHTTSAIGQLETLIYCPPSCEFFCTIDMAGTTSAIWTLMPADVLTADPGVPIQTAVPGGIASASGFRDFPLLYSRVDANRQIRVLANDADPTLDFVLVQYGWIDRRLV